MFEPNGTSFAHGNAPNRAVMFVSLQPWNERAGAEQSAEGVMRRLRPRLAQIANATVLAFNPPAIRGIGNLAGFQFELQDQDGVGIPALTGTARNLIADARRDPVLRNVSTTFRDDSPQLVVRDRPRQGRRAGRAAGRRVRRDAGLPGLAVRQRLRLPRPLLPGVRAGRHAVPRPALGDWSASTCAPDPRANKARRFRSPRWSAPGSTASPPIVTHYNLQRSIEINGVPAPGYGSGQALSAMTAAAANLPPGTGYEWTGISLEQIECGEPGRW